MLMPPAAILYPAELERAWGAEGETEYRQLLRVMRSARGGFFVFFIESDYSPTLRDTLLDCLRSDLAQSGTVLRRAMLSAKCPDIFALPELETGVGADDAFVLVGIEDTPGIVPEPGRKAERPPALAVLNRLRETLHSRLPVPFVVWCTPRVYTAMQQHAPDFFDHYAGLFQFMDAAPASLPDRLPVITNTDSRLPTTILSSAVAQGAAAFYEQQIAQHLEPTLERARALLGLADALLEMHGPEHLKHTQRSMQIVREALILLSPKRDAYEWAHGHNVMGTVYSDLPNGNREDNLQNAIACYKLALSVFTKTKFPYDWAMTHNNLGNAYSDLATGSREDNLQNAIACYKSALRVFTEDEFPCEWATTQHNLGADYSILPYGNRDNNLQQAIAHYEAALRVRTETTFPYQWARTQYNLGNAYDELPTNDPAQSIQQAIVCYDAALRVFTQNEFPYEWTMVQNNRGVAYSNLFAGDRDVNLHHAIDCFEAVLSISTEPSSSKDWADTQLNLALAQEELGDGEAARRALRCAIAGYNMAGLQANADHTERILQQLGYA